MNKKTIDKKAFEWLDSDDFAYNIWNNKYRFNKESFEDWIDRISNGNKEVKSIILEKRFIFGGRILANRGLDKLGINTTLSNCYVITPPNDSIESIFETASKMARTFSYGGGVGIDISNLRPKGAAVNNAAKTTTGAISFMDFFSYVTGLIGQQGRRGATMISISCTHPDVLDFINLKTDLEVCTKANISVRMSDEFFQCVEKDEDFFLYWRSDQKNMSQEVLFKQYSSIVTEYNKLYAIDDEEVIFYVKKVKAKELLKLLALRNWEMGEPGILYWDRISNYNILSNTDFEYAGVNPCAEEPLPAGGSCLLGSLNLSAFVKDSFTDDACIDYKSLEHCTKTAIRALNDVLIEGVQLHPLEEQRRSVSDWRQIGLGITGYGDMLIRLTYKYGSKEAISITEKLMKMIATWSVQESLSMAKEYGCYPKCEKEKLVHSAFISNLELDSTTIEKIIKYGLYNSQLLTIPPAGTISSLFNVSSGAEPNYDFKYYRKTVTLNDKETVYTIDTKIAQEYNKLYPNTLKPAYFIKAEQVEYNKRIATQSILQKYIDASISSTLNIKESSTVEDVYNIYIEAHKMGLKGCTVWRDNCKRAGILTKTINTNTKGIIPSKAPERPKELPADFHLIKYKGDQFTVVVGLLEGKPYEIFAYKNNIIVHNIPNHKGKIVRNGSDDYSFISEHLKITNLAEELANMEEKANTVYPSQLLRYGVPVDAITKTMTKLDDNIASFSSCIRRILSTYEEIKESNEKCPDCGEPLIKEGGCTHCNSCGYSKCG